MSYARTFEDRLKQQAREQREKLREIKVFNENLKNNPTLLNDELYLCQNMSQLTLKLKQLPEKHLDNVLLITDYFKTKRESVNFKYIKPEILNNRIFLGYAIQSNPELYFVINQDNQKTFKSVAISNDNEYLKYLEKEDYDNPEILKKIAFNFKTFHESLSCLNEDNFNKIVNSKHGEYAERDLLKINVEQCQFLKNALEPYLEKNKVTKGDYWFEDVLHKNPYFYTVLDQDKYKDKKSKELIINITGKHHDLFSYLPKEWKEDIEIVTRVIYDDSQTETRYQNSGMKYQPNVKNISLILNEYGQVDKFIKEKLNDNNMKFIRKAYPYLTEEWRKEERIIRSLFTERDSFEVDLNYCRSIPYEDLAEKLSTQVKNYKVRTLEQIGDTLEKVVLYHFMNKNMAEKNVKEKKLKI